MHTYDKFVTTLPESHEEGTQALHYLYPNLFDNKVVMSAAVDAGLSFPRTTLGDGYRWLLETQTTAPRESGPGTPAAVRAQSADGSAQKENGGSSDAAVVGNTPSKGNGVGGRGGGADMHGQAKEESNMEVDRDAQDASADGSASATGVGASVARAVWDASFAPGFEERYANGGQEHEAAYDAYLTGCCFVASATLGLGVTVREMKRMGTVIPTVNCPLGRAGEVPRALRPMHNLVPMYHMVSYWRTLFVLAVFLCDVGYHP